MAYRYRLLRMGKNGSRYEYLVQDIKTNERGIMKTGDIKPLLDDGCFVNAKWISNKAQYTPDVGESYETLVTALGNSGIVKFKDTHPNGDEGWHYVSLYNENNENITNLFYGLTQGDARIKSDGRWTFGGYGINVGNMIREEIAYACQSLGCPSPVNEVVEVYGRMPRKQNWI